MSPPFRTLTRTLTWYWVLMTLVYTGVSAAVTWAAPLDFAFAWVLGQLFLWAIVAGLGCWWIVRRGLRAEEKWLRGRKGVA